MCRNVGNGPFAFMDFMPFFAQFSFWCMANTRGANQFAIADGSIHLRKVVFVEWVKSGIVEIEKFPLAKWPYLTFF